jgi:hypothetical protein
MKPITIGVAAAALVAAGAVAAQGNGHGKGNGGGHGNAGHAQVSGSLSAAAHGHGHGNAMQAASQGHGHGNAMQAAAPAHGHGNAMQASVQAHGHGHADAMRTQGHANDHGQAKAQAHGDNGHAPDHAMAERGHCKPAARPANARPANARAAAQGEARPGPSPAVRVLADGRRAYSQRGLRPAFDFAAARRGPIDGCPPGLAKKHNGCQPPGLARQAAWQPAWWGLPAISGRYYYNDGYLVRLNGDSVAGYVPLLGGALAIGNPWPSYYEPMPVPDYYVNYYGLGPVSGYRYADDVLYRVDPETSAITGIAALLTGDNFVIGQPLPVGYDVYNVPYGYRAQYIDGPNAWYRYSDGYVYEVDPTTRLITAAIQLLAS